MGANVVADDPAGYQVRKYPFQPPPDFDPDLPLIPRYDQDGAVVLPLPSDAPRLGDADREILDGVAPQRRNRQDDDLRRLRRLEIGELLLQRAPGRLRKDRGVVVDVSPQRWDVGPRRADRHEKQEKDGENEGFHSG